MKKSIIFPVLLLFCIMSGCAVAPSAPNANRPVRPLPGDNSGWSEKKIEDLRRQRGIVRQQTAEVNNRRPALNAARNTVVADEINPAQTSEDPTFGYTKENPVKLGSQSDEQGQKAASSHVYLKQLRDKAHLPFKYIRIGNVGAGNDGHIVDLYKLTDSVGTESKVFIDMYHPDSNPLDCMAPKGMFIAQ